MSSLVNDLQAKIISGTISVTNAARAAMAISSKLNQPQIEDWLKSEIFGFAPESEIPEYRQVKIEPQFFNPYNGWCPIIIGSETIQKTFTDWSLYQSLGEVENLLNSDSDCAQITYAPALENFLRENAVTAGNLRFQFRIRGKLSKSFLYRVREHVQNTILNWLLELEKKGVTGRGMSFSDEEKRAASGPSQTIYAQNIGVVATSRDDSVQNISVHQDIEESRIQGLLQSVEPALVLLPERERAEISKQLALAQSEAASNNNSKVRSALESAKRIAEGVTGNVAAAGIVHLITSLLS
jgi:hypothetical protein